MTKLNLESDFIFTLCQVGAEGALKKELLREHPEFRFAFSRPGFVTFKNTQGAVPLDFSLQSVFARVFGVSYGMLTPSDDSKVLELAQALKSQAPVRKIRLHVYERDLHVPGDEPLGFQPGALVGDLEAQIRAQDSGIFEKSSQPEVGDTVIQVIALDPGKFGFGAYIHSVTHSSWPGGRPPISLPPEAPSRAYLKLEECLLWSKAPIRSGDLAVEIGSAPGGATYALLKRGLNVVGIDPAEMDPRVARHPQFKHIQAPVSQLTRHDLPESVQWLLLDMNVAPNISLFAVDRLASRMKSSLLGIILTVKLNQWKTANEIPYMLEHVAAIGMVRAKAAQLSFHRQEIVIYGLTRRGATVAGISLPKTKLIRPRS